MEDWGYIRASVRRFQQVLEALGVVCVRAYETSEWPPHFWWARCPDANPMAAQPVR